MAARYSLKGKTILITGAARGIGAEAARQVAARGARVVCVGLEPDELEKVARGCGGGALWFEADVTDTHSVEAAVDATVEQAGGIDVVVANAGIAVAGPVRRLSPDGFERVIDVNLLGVYRTVRACLPHVIERRGYALPVASLAAVLPYFPGFAAYSASKAGTEAFAHALSTEVAHLGVDVGVGYFPWIATEMVLGGDAELPAFRYLRSQLRWPVNKTHPVSDAGRAIVSGIERRSAVVTTPRWMHAALALRGLVGPLTKRDALKMAPEAIALYEAEYARDEAVAARAVGAGGDADADAAQLRS